MVCHLRDKNLMYLSKCINAQVYSRTKKLQSSVFTEQFYLPMVWTAEAAAAIAAAATVCCICESSTVAILVALSRHT
jgi:hypothetical protein